MSEFLSEQWLDDVREAINADPELLEATRKVDVTVVQTTTDAAPGGPGQFWFSFKHGAVEMEFGDPPSTPDATLSMNTKTALEVYTGAESFQSAVMRGRVKVSGNLAKLMSSHKALNGLMPVIGRVTSA